MFRVLLHADLARLRAFNYLAFPCNFDKLKHFFAKKVQKNNDFGHLTPY